MGMLEMSPEYVAEWRRKCRELAASKIEGEEILAAAGFRQGGASANYAASKAQLGGLVYAGIKMLRKKRAGGLPEKVILAVTPSRIYAFKLVLRGRDHRIGDEVARWERAGVKVGADRGGTMTSLTIESPADGDRASLVGIGVHDDPVSLEVIDVLQGAAPVDA
jgi:hypothetical protein